MNAVVYRIGSYLTVASILDISKYLFRAYYRSLCYLDRSHPEHSVYSWYLFMFGHAETIFITCPYTSRLSVSHLSVTPGTLIPGSIIWLAVFLEVHSLYSFHPYGLQPL